MVSFDVLIVFAVIFFILISLYLDLIGPAFTFMVAVVALGLLGILTPGEIMAGFANVQITVIIMLLIFGDIIRQTSILEDLFDKFFKKAKSYRSFSFRMMSLVAFFSAFLNNTPLVAIMMPYINGWSKRNSISPSKLLIPLSYSAILGGCITLVGTSTNLIVNGMVLDQDIFPDLPGLEIFDFFWVGLPMAITGILYLTFFGEKLLPDREDAMTEFRSQNRNYILQAQIKGNSPFIGKNIEESELQNLKGLYLVEIERQGEIISAVSHQTELKKDDMLIFAGDTETIADTINSTNSGLTFPTLGTMQHRKYTEVVEIVVSHNSSLIYKTVLGANFRGKYDAAVISIHRNGERIHGKISNVKIKAGDVLLLYVGNNFYNRAASTIDFYLFSKIKTFRKSSNLQLFTLFGGLALAILLSAVNLVPLFMSLVVLLITVQVINIISPKDIHNSIDYNLGFIIALSLALGTAMMKTGVADMIASLFINLFLPYGKVALLAGIFVVTNLMANFITNKASVAIAFPISLTMAANLGLPPQPFILVVAFAAAANFMTPIGYQTNLMVYGPGGYNFKDFFNIGIPLTIIYGIATIVILSVIYLR